MGLVHKIASRALSERVRSAYDCYLDKLPELLSSMDVVARSFGPTGEQVMKLCFVGGKTNCPMFVESDGTVHPLTAREAHLRQLSYTIPLYSDVHVHRSEGSSSILPDVFLGKIPLMVGSRRCQETEGGHFVIHGQRKTIVEVKAHAHNVPIIYHKTTSGIDHWTVSCKSQLGTAVFVCSMKLRNRALMVSFPKLEKEIDLRSLLRLLGSDREPRHPDLFDLDQPPTELKLKKTYNLGDEQEERVVDVLQNQLLPHTAHKAHYLLYMADTLAQHIRENRSTDKDSLFSQRIETVDDLLGSLTTNLLLKMKHELRSYLQKMMGKKGRCLEDKGVRKALARQTTLTDGLSFAMATGTWSTMLVDKRSRPGICQLIQAGSPIVPVAQLLRIKSSIRPDQKLTKPRLLHHTSFGRICPVATPEGASVGLEANLALGASISMQADSDAVLQLVARYIVTPDCGSYVFLDGALVGGTQDPEALCEAVRKLRREGTIPKDVSVAYRRVVHIRCSSGRILRALLRVAAMPVPDLPLEKLERGYIEWLDVFEEDTVTVAMSRAEIDNHDYVEIHPGLMLSICGSMVPLVSHKPPARTVYQCGMAKQAIGPQLSDDMHTTSNYSVYSQRPLVRSELAAAFLPAELDAAGINVVVAVMPANRNQEDSLIISQGAIDRGLGVSVQYKTVKVSLASNPGETVELGEPEKAQLQPYNLKGGLPYVGQRMKEGEYLVGRIKTVAGQGIDDSVMSPVEGVVDRVMRIKERSGSVAYHIRLRKIMVPCLGDKFAQRDAQKGVLGSIRPQEDMPFTRDGVPIDIIISPFAFPSRMTISYLLEGTLAKLGAKKGRFEDASPFRTIEDLQKLTGHEWVYNGCTGERYREPISVLMCFYQKLKHMASQKLHCRATGTISELSRAPCSGRARSGGLRFGEMERDCLVAHGAPHLLQNQLMKSSDETKIVVCVKCKTYDCPCLRKKKKRRFRKTPTKKISVPYSFKLLLTELQAMGIKTDLHV